MNAGTTSRPTCRASSGLLVETRRAARRRSTLTSRRCQLLRLPNQRPSASTRRGGATTMSEASSATSPPGTRPASCSDAQLGPGCRLFDDHIHAEHDEAGSTSRSDPWRRRSEHRAGSEACSSTSELTGAGPWRCRWRPQLSRRARLAPPPRTGFRPSASACPACRRRPLHGKRRRRDRHRLQGRASVVGDRRRDGLGPAAGDPTPRIRIVAAPPGTSPPSGR